MGLISIIKKAKMGGRVNKNNAPRKIKETASNAKIREKLIRYAFEQHEDAPADMDAAVRTIAGSARSMGIEVEGV